MVRHPVPDDQHPGDDYVREQSCPPPLRDWLLPCRDVSSFLYLRWVYDFYHEKYYYNACPKNTHKVSG